MDIQILFLEQHQSPEHTKLGQSQKTQKEK